MSKSLFMRAIAVVSAIAVAPFAWGALVAAGAEGWTAITAPVSAASGVADAVTTATAGLLPRTGGCEPPAIVGTPEAPGAVSTLGVVGTTTADLADFAQAINDVRAQHCLDPIPGDRFVHDPCMEARLVWMAEDPSEDPSSAWGHLGTERSDGVPSVGCDGNLAGGTGNSPAVIAQKWWDDEAYREALYLSDDEHGGQCLAFAMTHGGVPNEPYPFTRAAAVWTDCPN